MKRDKRETVDKHFTYFTVLETLQKSKGCAFCDLKKKVSFKYLDALLYEKVNDPGIRKELAKSNGYCHRHAHQLVSLGGALGIGIIYNDQLSYFLKFIDSKKSKVSKTRQGKRKVQRNTGTAESLWVREDMCPVCRVEQETLSRYFVIFVDSLKEREDSKMRNAFESSHGICVPHFLEILEYANTLEIREYLIKHEKLKLQSIQEVLREFIRKQDYRFEKEPVTKEEGKSWIDSVIMMTGSKDAF